MRVDFIIGLVILGVILTMTIYTFAFSDDDKLYDDKFRERTMESTFKEGISGALLGFSIASVAEYTDSGSFSEAMDRGTTGTAAGFVSGILTGITFEAVGDPIFKLVNQEFEKRKICDERCYMDHLKKYEKEQCYESCMELDNLDGVVAEIHKLRSK